MAERESAPRALILFGPPGSGKGTQATLIRDCLGVPHISTGDMLRERMQQTDELGVEIRKRLEAGELVTGELVDRMVEERISRPDCAKGFILDGYPRTLSQAATMASDLGKGGIDWLVVHLKVDYNEIIRRLAARRSCVQCGAVYNLTSRPPAVTSVCDVCSGPLGIRDDDRESVIRKRLEAYDAQTRPLLEFFSQGGYRFVEVDGVSAPPQEIAQGICELARSKPGNGKTTKVARGR